MNGQRAVIVGLGNEYRSDDAVGVVVARRVVATSPSTADLGPIGEPLELLNRWDGATIAVVIDATRSGSPPGTLSVLDLDEHEPGACRYPYVGDGRHHRHLQPLEHHQYFEHHQHPG